VLVEQVCQLYALLWQRPLHIVNCHQYTETSDFLGGLRPNRSASVEPPSAGLASASGVPDTAAGAAAGGSSAGTADRSLFHWYDGPLITAMKNGHMFLLDELSLADDGVLERLNSVLEPSRRVTLAVRRRAVCL
jgi:midasin